MHLMQVQLFKGIPRDLFDSRIERFGLFHNHFHPIRELCIAECFQMLHIIRMIIGGDKKSLFVEAVDEQSLMIEITEAHRTLNFGHAECFCISFHFCKECPRYLDIVDDVISGKTNAAFVPDFVEAPVVDCGDSADRLFAAECHKIACAAIGKRGIFVFFEVFHFVHHKRRNIIRIPYIKTVGKGNKPF